MDQSSNSLQAHVQPMGQIILGAGVSVAFHPMTYAKVLIQLGYEPLPPVSKRSIFGRQVLSFPSIFKYLGYIKKQDGFLGLYRGLGARLVGGVIGSSVTNHALAHLKAVHPVEKSEIEEDEEFLEAFKRMAKETTHEMVARCAGVIASQPCHVIMIRAMAQFVGRETKYDNIFVSIATIYKEEGIWGFFAGLAPRLFGEALTIWLVNVLVHLINNYLLPKETGPKGLRTYSNAVCTMMVTQLTYPFSLVSNIMAVNTSGLAAGSPPLMDSYSGWRNCMCALNKEGSLKRGSSMFFRYYRGPVIMRHDGKLMPADNLWHAS